MLATETISQTDIFYPPTSTEFGLMLTNSQEFEEVRLADKTIVGSDLWLNMVMNMGTELQAIARFKQNFHHSSPELPSSLFESECNHLLGMYLRTQFQFCLAENGCNKHLQIQPDYIYEVSKDPNGIFISPKDLSKFGDLAKKYISTNPRVGAGLALIYESIVDDHNSRFGAGIVSPSEEYKGFGSDWDVINLMTADTGKYLICKRVLSITERRFLHNLFFELGKNEHTLSSLLQMTPEELNALIPTDRLNTNHSHPTGIPEYQSLVRDPNKFQFEEDNIDLFTVACDINTLYQKVFNESLFENKDIEMYPIINELVEAYLPDLQSLLLSGDQQDYYQLLRQMIYHCQALWKGNQLVPPTTHSATEDNYYFYLYNQEIQEHLGLLMNGVIFAGFEFAGGDDLTDPFSSTINQFDFSQSFGWETTKKCKTHGVYEGDHCPKCSHQSE